MIADKLKQQPIYWDSVTEHLVIQWFVNYVLVLNIRYELKYVIKSCVRYEPRENLEETLYFTTNCMESSPFSESDNFSAGQEIPFPFVGPSGFYRVHKNPPYVLIVSYLNPNQTYPILLRYSFILFSHLHLGLSSGLILSGFSTKIL